MQAHAVVLMTFNGACRSGAPPADSLFFRPTVEVELSDELGNVKNIWGSEQVYATSLLNVERENLVLLQVKRNVAAAAAVAVASSRAERRFLRSNSNQQQQQQQQVEEEVTYVPLLKNEKIINSKFTGLFEVLFAAFGCESAIKLLKTRLSSKRLQI